MKRLLTAFAALVLLSCGAQAAFPDNPPGQWYYDAVEYAQSAGWITGYSDGGAHPEDVLSKEQAITILTRVRGYEPLGVGGFWSAGYVERGIQEGYVTDRANLTAPLSRYDAAVMVYRAYGLDGMNFILWDTPFTDVNSREVTGLYELGVITGTGKGLFLPNGQLSRAQLCAMLMRMNESERVIAFLAGEEEPKFEVHTEYLLTPPQEPPAVLTDDESIMQAYLYLCLSGKGELKISVPGTRDEAAKVVERLGEITEELGCFYPEYLSIYNGYSARMQQTGTGGWAGTLTMTFPEGRGPEQAAALRELLFRRTAILLKELFAERTLELTMSQTEMARVWATYIAENASYDKADAVSSHYGADFFADGTLVCEGYTAVYNLGLRYLGIQCYGVGGTMGGVNHIWTMAYLDGAWKAIDLTYMDPVGGDEVDYSYFALDEEELMSMRDGRVKWENTIPIPQPQGGE